MDDPAAPRGERFVPEVMGGKLLEAEHDVRYRHAARLVLGRSVLDAGCGVGWGSALLARAGAASVTGLDIDAGVLKDAAARTDAARFVRGDLLALPFADASFDVVVCYEAIEHVTDPLAGLDELRRVLTSDGVLTVSSSNPGVHPAGNPSHNHGLAPGELERALAARFRYASAWQQHPMLASVVLPGEGFLTSWWWASVTRVDQSTTTTLASLTMEDAAYSIFDASAVQPGDQQPQVALASATQFTELHDLIERYRTVFSAYADPGDSDEARDATRVLRAERDHIRAELDRTLLLLLEAEQELARRRDGATT